MAGRQLGFQAPLRCFHLKPLLVNLGHGLGRTFHCGTGVKRAAVPALCHAMGRACAVRNSLMDHGKGGGIHANGTYHCLCRRHRFHPLRCAGRPCCSLKQPPWAGGGPLRACLPQNAWEDTSPALFLLFSIAGKNTTAQTPPTSCGRREDAAWLLPSSLASFWRIGRMCEDGRGRKDNLGHWEEE